MNKFKAWLIKKLGGYTSTAERPVTLYHRVVPIENFRIKVGHEDPKDYVGTEQEYLSHIDELASARLGRYLIQHGFCQIKREEIRPFQWVSTYTIAAEQKEEGVILDQKERNAGGDLI